MRRNEWPWLLGIVLATGCGEAHPQPFQRGATGGSGESSSSASTAGGAAGLSSSGAGPGSGTATTGAGGSLGSGGTGSGGSAGSGESGAAGAGGVIGVDAGSGGAAGGGGSSAQDAGPVTVPNTVVLDGQKLAQAKQRLAAGDATLQATLGKLLALANAELTAGPWSVMNKTTTPPSGSKHDYISLARYYWPGNSANGCPYVHKDGETNPDCASSRWDHASRHAAMDAIYHLSVAWYFTADARFANRAALVARTWFLDPATSMNPNIDFGEGVPCLRDGAGTGVLNWTEVIGEALDGIAILDSGAPGWSSADQAGMRTWLTAFLKWLQTNALATKEKAAANNHGTWYDTGVSAIMLYLGQMAETKALVENSKKRIASQIKSDGSQPEELSRTNTWGYSNWNLEGFCLLASTASHVGTNLWTYAPAGAGTIAKAADYLIQGAEKGKASWTHQQIAPFEPSWALSALHAAADYADDANARAAIPLVAPPPEGDLWPLLPICVPAAIQVN